MKQSSQGPDKAPSTQQEGKITVQWAWLFFFLLPAEHQNQQQFREPISVSAQEPPFPSCCSRGDTRGPGSGGRPKPSPPDQAPSRTQQITDPPEEVLPSPGAKHGKSGTGRGKGGENQVLQNSLRSLKEQRGEGPCKAAPAAPDPPTPAERLWDPRRERHTLSLEKQNLRERQGLRERGRAGGQGVSAAKGDPGGARLPGRVLGKLSQGNTNIN